MLLTLLAPQGVSGAFTLTADAGSLTITGQDAILRAGRVLQADAGALTIAGQNATLKAGRVLKADAGALTITGQDATLTYTPVGAFTLQADAGALTITGQDAVLRAGRVLKADAGALTITGQGASLIVGRRLQADAGALTITGQNATLTYTPLPQAYTLIAEAGSLTITGHDAILRYRVPLVIARGSIRPQLMPPDVVIIADVPTGVYRLRDRSIPAERSIAISIYAPTSGVAAVSRQTIATVRIEGAPTP